jgi:hypothetical protein
MGSLAQTQESLLYHYKDPNDTTVCNHETITRVKGSNLYINVTIIHHGPKPYKMYQCGDQ